MKEYRGLFIGLTTIDIQYFVEKFPESNTKIKTKVPEILVGGPATNAAVSFAYLNGKAFLASALGNNSFSDFTKNDFINTKISHIDLVQDQNVNPVIASVITNNRNGERNIFTHHPENITTNVLVEELLTNLNPDIVLLDSFYPEFGIESAKWARKKNIPVIVDGGSWKPQYEEILKYTDIIICSEDFYPPDCHSTNDVFQYLESRFIEKIAITRGDKSILFRNGENRGELNIPSTAVIDTLGAGDFFHGAFCYYLLHLKDFVDSLKKASELATFTCKHPGTRKWLIV